MSLKNTKSQAQLSREASHPLHSLIMTIAIVGTIISFFGIASTSDAPSDGPLPPIHQGQLAGGVRESIR
jgi:hypothetical protein